MTIDSIRSYIQTEILNDSTFVIEEDQDLLLSETLDSLSVTRLVEYLERQYGVTIPAQDVTLENFASLRRIQAYLESRKG
ncbi:MAG: acyl carrier protein [Planctomycetota bacterium]